MKKIIMSFFLTIFAFALTAQVPPELHGIWRGKDRIIFFGDTDFSIILKEYYGWYFDRADEPKEFSEASARSINLATTKEAYHYEVSFTPILEDVPVWEMTISHGKKITSVIPVAVNDGKLYLNFMLSVPYDESQNLDTKEEILRVDGTNPLYGYWSAVNTADSIRLSPRHSKENIYSWYISENGCYRLRFWKSKMEFETAKAVFTDAGKIFTINKHIFSAGTNFSCVSGRGSKIRNVEKFPTLPFDMQLDETGKIMLLGEPYLVRETEKNSVNELLEIVSEANSRRKPDPPPLFAPLEIDWHWDLIEELDKDNKLIKEAREKQRPIIELSKPKK